MSEPFAVVSRIERLENVDELARAAQKAVARLVPQQSFRKDFLSGTWMGRPLHPALTDVVIGSWLGVTLLDLLGEERTGRAADHLLSIGNLSAVPTVAAGMSDWAELWGEAQRLGSIHALGNVAALGLQLLSSSVRRRGRRNTGKLLSIVAMGVAGGAAYLGGHLSFVRGVGVNQTAFESGPQEWTPVMAEGDLPAGTLKQHNANGVRVMLYREGDEIFALSDRCTHRGCPLHLGQVRGSSVECPCHGSVFRLSDGGVLRGPATVPAPSYEVRGHHGMIEVRRPVASQWGRKQDDV